MTEEMKILITRRNYLKNQTKKAEELRKKTGKSVVTSKNALDFTKNDLKSNEYSFLIFVILITDN